MNDAEHFLGRGWSFPPRFSRNGAELETVAGPQDIQESLAILFSTEPGERVMRSDYGCGLQPLVFAEMDQELVSMLRSRVASAFTSKRSSRARSPSYQSSMATT